MNKQERIGRIEEIIGKNILLDKKELNDFLMADGSIKLKDFQDKCNKKLTIALADKVVLKEECEKEVSLYACETHGAYPEGECVCEHPFNACPECGEEVKYISEISANNIIEEQTNE